MKTILDEKKGTREILHKQDDKVIIESIHDVTGIVKANKFQRDHAPMRHTEEVFNHKARIDTNAIKQWCKVKGITWADFFSNPEHLRTFLNDPENEVWLTRKGKV